MHSDTLEICLDKVAGTESFDEIRIGRFTRISFHRTLRIPEDGRDYPLPAGLGRFPIHRVEDYADKVPAKWLQEGGFFIPLYQKEALFLQFEGPDWHPTIAKVCVGRINAITGKPYSETLSNKFQDYIVIPEQKWLDGISSGEGLVRQFVAMPLAQGYTIEAQITDEEKFGGFQLVFMDAIDGRFPDRDPAVDSRIKYGECQALFAGRSSSHSSYSIAMLQEAMGIAAGGNIKQQIQKDSYGIESWSFENRRSLTIHLVNSRSYKAITGCKPPPSPVTAAQYQRARIPWYSHYDETASAIKPSSIFKRILGISGIEKKRGIVQMDDEKLRVGAIRNIQNIRTPDKLEASNAFRERAHESRKMERWESAVREISHVIDLAADVRADDYALRSCCNFHLGRYRDGSIDGSLALEKDGTCVEALSWRASCRKALGDHEGMCEDADELSKHQETELLGMELKAEASLLSGRYQDAIYEALYLGKKMPGHQRAGQILDEARERAYQQHKERNK